MSRPPCRRRPSRVHRWEGVVDEVCEVCRGSFWALLTPVDHSGPDLVAEFDLARLPDAQPGLLFNLYTYRRGRKRRVVLRARRSKAWTAEQLAVVRTATGERLNRVGAIVD